MDKYIQALQKIIAEQEKIVGPVVAWNQVRKVSGIRVGGENEFIISSLNGDPKKILAELTRQYSELFGQASTEVCKEAIQTVLPLFAPDELPDILK